jgi:hypothetical protein
MRRPSVQYAGGKEKKKNKKITFYLFFPKYISNGRRRICQSGPTSPIRHVSTIGEEERIIK